MSGICPLCGSPVETVPYRKTVMFGDTPIKYDSTIEHCANPDCAEPDWFTYDQLIEQKQQRLQQLAAQSALGLEDVS